MSRFKIDDFPPAIQAQIRAQLDGYAKPITPPASSLPPLKPATPLNCHQVPRPAKGPNKTEADYQRTLLRGKDARFEAITFRMANGHRYTPDWVVFQDGTPVECHEVKGAYALHSQQRARLAFDQARTEFPGLKWVWATKTNTGWET